VWLVAAACLVVASVVVAAACGGDGDTVQGPSAEELTAQAQSLDAAGADLEEQAVSYATIVASVDKAADKNATALKKWDKEWTKRQAAYDKDVAEVEAYNASEREKAAANPQRTLKTKNWPFYDFVTGKTVYPDGKYTVTVIPGYAPQLMALPDKPTMPAKVKVKLSREIKRLKKLDAQLGELDKKAAALVVGDEFAAPLDDLQTAVAELQVSVREARKALKKAVTKDKKRGDVIATKMVQGLEAGDLEAQVAALREALRQAAESAGVGGALTWISSGPGASAAPSTSVSASP
jgi:hypothetical protein